MCFLSIYNGRFIPCIEKQQSHVAQGITVTSSLFGTFLERSNPFTLSAYHILRCLVTYINVSRRLGKEITVFSQAEMQPLTCRPQSETTGKAIDIGATKKQDWDVKEES